MSLHWVHFRRVVEDSDYEDSWECGYLQCSLGYLWLVVVLDLILVIRGLSPVVSTWLLENKLDGHVLVPFGEACLPESPIWNVDLPG